MYEPQEPIITDQDRVVQERWERECRAWSGLREHRSRIEWAEREVDKMLTACPTARICWSSGKDSTVLVHLMRVRMGLDTPVMSLCTDLELPGTLEYTRVAAAAMGVEVEIIEPTQSFWAWVVAHASELRVDEEVTRGHSKIGGLWDQAMDAWAERVGAQGIFWGLRKEESRGRKMNHAMRGSTYQMADGRWRSAPLIHWTGRDVYAYAYAHEVPLHPVYGCLRFHAQDPSRLRKSMWLPGEFAARGEIVWLRTYYPSLYERLREVMPDASRWT